MADAAFSLLVAGIKWPPETFLARLIHGLLAHGVRVTVATSARPDAAWIKRRGFVWLPEPAWNGPPSARLLRLARLWTAAQLRGRSDMARFAAHIAGEKEQRQRLRLWNRWLPYAGRRWDVIYFPWNSAAIERLPLFALGMPVVLSCRGAQVSISPHNPRRQELVAALRTTFQQAAAVHCVSKAICAEAQAYGLAPAKATIIRPAIDPDFFLSAVGASERQSGVLRVITTGSLIWRKGYEYALTAIRQLLDQNVPVHFQIIGSGPERQRLLYTIDDLGLQQHVTLSGQLAPAAVRDSLQQADVFLLSSLSEGISNAVLEAMACGLPVVSSSCGGMAEVIDDGVEGFLAPPRDPAAMAEALLTLYRSPERRRSMGRAARQRIFAQGLTLEEQAAAFHALFLQVIKTQPTTQQGMVASRQQESPA